MNKEDELRIQNELLKVALENCVAEMEKVQMGKTLRELAESMSAYDHRCVAYLYRSCITAARELRIYAKRRRYTPIECHDIRVVVARLFPVKGSDE